MGIRFNPETGSIEFEDEDEDQLSVNQESPTMRTGKGVSSINGETEGVVFGADGSIGFESSDQSDALFQEQQEKERQDRINERIQYIRDTEPDYIGSEITTADGKKVSVSEDYLRKALDSGEYAINLTEEEQNKWNEIKESKRQQELRESPWLADKIGQGARDWGNDFGVRFGDWKGDLEKRGSEFAADPLGELKKGVENVASGFVDSIRDATIDYSDTPEMQARRAEGEIVRPKAVNETDEEYAQKYYFYEDMLAETNSRLQAIEQEMNSGTGRVQQINPDSPAGRLFGINKDSGDKTLEDVKSLSEEKKNLERTRYTLERYLGQKSINRNIFGAESLAGQADAMELVPFIGTTDRLADADKARQIFEKFDKGEDLDDLEKSVFNKYVAHALDSRINYGLGANVGVMMSELPTFAVEFAATGGFSTAAKSGLEKVATKVGTDSVVRSVGSSVIKSNIAKMVAGSAAQTAIGFAPRVGLATVENMMPYYDVVATEEGDAMVKKLDEGDDFVKAFAKGFGTTYVEVFTEELGAFVEEPIQVLKKGILSKFSSKLARETGEAVTPSVMSKALEQMGWNGLIGEVMEEEVGEFLNAPIEGRTYQDPFTTQEGRERFLTEFVGIAAFAGVAQVPSTAIAARNQVLNKYDSQGVTTTIPLEVDKRSTNWKKEIRSGYETLAPEQQAKLNDGIDKMQKMLDEYQDGKLIEPANIPGEIKSLLLQGKIPTLEQRIGDSVMKKIANQAGMLPVTPDGEVDMEAIKALDSVEKVVPIDNEGRPIDEENNQEVAVNQEGNAVAEPGSVAEVTQQSNPVDASRQALEEANVWAQDTNVDVTDGQVEGSTNVYNRTLENIDKSDFSAAEKTKLRQDLVNVLPSANDAVAQQMLKTMESIYGLTPQGGAAATTASADGQVQTNTQSRVSEALKETGKVSPAALQPFEYLDGQGNALDGDALIQELTKQGESINPNEFREVTEPVLVSVASDGSATIVDGSHRYAQALVNEKVTGKPYQVPYRVVNPGRLSGYNTTVSQNSSAGVSRQATNTTNNNLNNNIQSNNGTTIQGQQSQQSSTTNQESQRRNEAQNIWQAARSQKQILEASLSTQEIQVADLIAERQIEKFGQSVLDTAAEFDAGVPSWLPLEASQVNEFLEGVPDDYADWVTTNQPFAAGSANAAAWNALLNQTGQPSDFGGIELLEADRAMIENTLGMTLEEFESKVSDALNKRLSPAERTAPPQQTRSKQEAKTKPRRRFGQDADVITSTQSSREAASAAPVQSEGEIRESKAYSRIVDKLGDAARGDVTYNKINLAEDAAKGIEFAQRNPKIAEKIAKGLELPPEGITETAISLAVAEQALADGNYKLASEVEASRSLRQTRRGQEIVAERGRIDENSPQFFIEQVIAARIQQANNPSIFYRVGEQSEGSKKQTTTRISKEAAQAKQRLSPEQIKLKRAQEVIDALTCV